MQSYVLRTELKVSAVTKSDLPAKESSASRSKPHDRIHWIDVAKGLGIVLVTFGHIRNGAGQSVWLPALDKSIDVIYLFHMPFFFFLGGLTFSSRKPFLDFLKSKAKTLLIPYYVFSLYFLTKPIALLMLPSLAGSMRIDTDYTSGIARQFYDILINGSGLWFLWAYFIGEMMVFPLSRLYTARWQYILSSFAFIGIYVSITNAFPSFSLPFCALRGIEVAGFILLGKACKDFLISITSRLVSGGLFLSSLTLFSLSILWELNAATHWGHIIGSTVAMFLGVGLSVFFSIFIARNTVIEYIGRHSLSFYAVNAFTLNIGKMVFFKIIHINGLHSSILLQWIIGILLVTFCLILLAIEDIIIRKLIPWSLGIKRQKKISQEIDTI